MNIFIKNISFKVTEDDLRSIFSEYGEVKSVRIITDPVTRRSRGFGFVEMPNEDEAKSAIDSINGAELLGRVLTVNEAKPRENREGFNRSRNSNNSYGNRERRDS